MKIKKWSGSAWVQDYPEVDISSIVTTGTPSSSTFLRGDGAWAVPAETGDISNVSAGDGLTGGGSSGSVTISHGDTSSQSSVNNSNGTVIQDITLDTYGHITGLTSYNLDGRYYTESESNARYLTRYSTSLLDVNAANGTQLYTGSTGQWTNRGPSGNNAGALLSLNTHSGNYYSQLWFDTSNDQFYFRSSNNSLPTTSWQKVWHDGNDGSGSSLDSDKLDGQHGSYYLDYNNFTNTPTIPTDTVLTTEQVEDIVGGMLSGNSESGITVVYEDGDGTIDFNVNDPTITLTGDVTGSATMTNLGNVSITATVADDSHNHTIANVDNLQSSLNGKLSTTAAAAALTYVTSCPTSANSTGLKVYIGSTDCSSKFSGWLYIVT